MCDWAGAELLALGQVRRWTAVVGGTARGRTGGGCPRRANNDRLRSVTRAAAIEYATEYVDSGAFLDDLSRRVSYRTESQARPLPEALGEYLAPEMVPAAHRLGAQARVL